MNKEEQLPVTFYVRKRDLERITEAASEEYLNRTAFIRRAVMAAVKSRETVAA